MSACAAMGLRPYDSESHEDAGRAVYVVLTREGEPDAVLLGRSYDLVATVPRADAESLVEECGSVSNTWFGYAHGARPQGMDPHAPMDARWLDAAVSRRRSKR